MLKKYILISAIAINSTVVLAAKPLDSIGVENNNGKKLIIHKVDPKESYYSISRRYNVDVKTLQDFNKNVGLQIGTVLKVPTDIPFAALIITNSPTNTAISSFEYTVAPKDNLNMIAERYATTVTDLKRLNNLPSNNLQVGQVLKVPFTKTAPTAQQVVRQVQTTQTTVINPNAVTEHVVKPKEYLGIIAKQYGVTVDDLKTLNELTSINLRIGQVLKIPTASADERLNTAPVTTAKEIVLSVPTAVQPEIKIVEVVKKEVKPLEVVKPVAKPVELAKSAVIEEPTFEHIVASGETIYAIAQRYQLTTFQLKTFNNITSNDLTVGQKLLIKGEKPATAATTISEIEEETADGTVTLKNPELRRPAAVYGLNKIEEKGTAIWILDPDLDPSKMLILHRVAPVGTIVQITNPMTNRSTFAKVVGKFTENESTKDVIIVMTKAVADAVGALDKRFFCNIAYGPKDNEK